MTAVSERDNVPEVERWPYGSFGVSGPGYSDFMRSQVTERRHQALFDLASVQDVFDLALNGRNPVVFWHVAAGHPSTPIGHEDAVQALGVLGKDDHDADVLPSAESQFWGYPQEITLPIVLRLLGYTGRSVVFSDKLLDIAIPEVSAIDAAVATSGYTGRLYPINAVLELPDLRDKIRPGRAGSYRVATGRRYQRDMTGWDWARDEIYQNDDGIYFMGRCFSAVGWDDSYSIRPTDAPRVTHGSVLFHSGHNTHADTISRVEHLLKDLILPEGATVLDPTCGDGMFLRAMSYMPQFASVGRFLGYDISPTHWDFWHRDFDAYPTDPRLSFACADSTKLDRPDASVDFAVIYHSFDQFFSSDTALPAEPFLRTISRVVKPGGFVYVWETGGERKTVESIMAPWGFVDIRHHKHGGILFMRT